LLKFCFWQKSESGFNFFAYLDRSNNYNVIKSDILKEKERERGCHNFFPLRQNRQHDDVTFVPTITKNVTLLPLTIKYDVTLLPLTIKDDVTFIPSTIKYDVTFIPSTIKYDVTLLPLTIKYNVTFVPSTIKYDVTFIPSTIKYDVTFVPTITKNVTFLSSTYSTM
jgi:hypothetical protein